MSWEQSTVQLAPGSVLVLYTDGVTEAFSPESYLYGQDRLYQVIRAAGEGSAQAMLEAIDGSVLAHIGSASPSDDLTLMVMRRSG